MIKAILSDFYDVISLNIGLNYELLDFYKTVSNKIDIYIFTSGTVPISFKHNSDYKGIFKDFFGITNLSENKTNKIAYLSVLKKINLKPTEVLFIDNSEVNINAAKEIGINTIKYINTDKLIKDLKKKFNIS